MIKKVTAVITCAGKGERAGFGYNKLLKDLGGITPFEKCVSVFKKVNRFDKIIITCSLEDKEIFEQKCLGLDVNAQFVIGGATRTESVFNALSLIDDDNFVLIHDGARSSITEDVINRCIDCTLTNGTGIVAIPATDTIAQTDGNGNILSSSRKNLYAVQTPQGFNVGLLKKAYILKNMTVT